MNRLFSEIICSALLVLTGCNSFEMEPGQTKRTILQYGQAAEESELAKIGEGYLRQTVAALEQGKYDLFTEHYIEEYKSRLTHAQFSKMADAFRKRKGKLKRVRFLGSVDRYSSRVLLWSVVFERTPDFNEQLKKAGKDPERIPDIETLVQMVVGKTEQNWKIIQMTLQ